MWVVEKKDNYKGYQYAVCLNHNYGYRCGYVKIPENNPLYKRDYMDMPIHSVYITFGNTHKELSGWCIGFDHAHLYDGVDVDAIKKYNPNNYQELLKQIDFLKNTDWELLKVATLDTVEKECQELIDEIIKLSEEE